MYCSHPRISAVMWEVHRWYYQCGNYRCVVTTAGEPGVCSNFLDLDPIQGITLQELLATVKTTEYFHKYFYGQVFHLYNNYYTMNCLLSFKNCDDRQTAHWVQCLQVNGKCTHFH
jgi:hypothetical protein